MFTAVTESAIDVLPNFTVFKKVLFQPISTYSCFGSTFTANLSKHIADTSALQFTIYIIGY